MMMKMFDKSLKFNPINEWGYMCEVSDGERSKTIPLIVEEYHFKHIERLMKDIDTDLKFDLFVLVVTGCLTMVMKTHNEST